MQDITLTPAQRIFRITALFFLLLVFLLLGSLSGFLSFNLLTGEDLTQVIATLDAESITPRIQVSLMIMQAISQLVGFLLLPLLFIWVNRSMSPGSFFEGRISPVHTIALTVIVVIIAMPVMAPLVEWNKNIHLPDSLGTLKYTFEEMEATAARLTRLLTTFDHIGLFLLGIVVIAVIPAVAEEFVFRGILQQEIKKASGNPHVAIWLAGFLFSFIHFQFFGFFPRMLLGVLFGYLYHWTNHLAVPIVAHFTNNCFTLTMIYLYHTGVTDIDLEATDQPPVYGIVLSAIMVGALLWYYRKIHRNN